ncbi:MAG: ABC transporter permease [Oscillospiraceae bacterium]|nr:ABC transporter permease [Oscillospiraceae bacterium]
MKNISAIFLKQMKDTLKNKMVLIQFVMFPVLAVIMQNAVKPEGMPEHFFAKLFAVMFVAMAPLSSMAAIISEEKEKNTLRVLIMSSVKSAEYLIGIGIYVFVMSMFGTAVFAILGGYRGADLAMFIALICTGILLSGLTGAVIGVFSKNQMASSSLSVPVSLVFSLLPMLSMFNEKIKDIARMTYSQQISELINGIGNSDITSESIVVISVNFLIAAVLFILIYKRKGLE